MGCLTHDQQPDGRGAACRSHLLEADFRRDTDRAAECVRIPNTTTVNDPLGSTLVQLARTPVVGKPYTASETNHPFPAHHACEGIPILAASPLFHDGDGLVTIETDRTQALIGFVAGGRKAAQSLAARGEQAC